MNIYALEPRFNIRTGQPEAPAMAVKGWICDFCGKPHLHEDDEDPACQVEVTYILNEVGGSEPQFDQLRIAGYEKVIHIYDVFSQHPDFCYCSDWDLDQYCERNMVRAAALGQLGEFRLLCDFMYEARCRMLARVLREKQYSLTELGLKEYSY